MINNFGFGATFFIKDAFSEPIAKAKKGLFDLKGTMDSFMGSDIGKGLMSGFAVGTAITEVGLAMLAPFQTAIQTSMDFNAQMSKVGAITRATGEDFAALKDLAKELGATTAFTAKQAGEAMQFLGMAGFKTNQILAATPATMELAAASGLELAKTADIASNVMTTFGINASDMSRAADVMALATNTANVNMTQLGESVKYSAGIVKTFGVGFEETVAAIGLLGNAGLQGSVATQTLSTAFTRLANPTGKMALMLDELKKTTDFTGFFDSAGQFVGIAGAFEQLEKATAGKTPEQIAKIQSTLFGSNAMKNIASLADATYSRFEEGIEVVYRGSQAIREYERDLRNSEGAASDMSKKMLDNLKGDMTLMDSALEGFKLAIGDSLEPVVRSVVQAFTTLVSAVSQFLDTPIGRFVSRLAAGFALLVTGLGIAITVFYAIKIAIYAVIPAIVAMSKAMFAAVSSFLVAAAPILAVVAAIALVVAAGYGLYKALSEGSEGVVRLALAFSLLFPAVGLIVAPFAIVTASLKRFNDFLNSTEAPAGGFVGVLQRIGGILTFVKEAWNSFVFDAEKGFVFQIDENLLNAMENLGLGEFATNAITWISRLKIFFMGLFEGIKNGFAVVGDVIGAIWDSFSPAVDALGEWSGLISKNESALEKWKRAGLIAGYAVVAVLGTIALGLAVVAAAVLLTIAPFVAMGWAIYKLYGYMGQLAEAFSNGFATAKAWVLDVWSAISGFTSYITTLLTPAINAIGNAFQTVWNIGVAVFETLATLAQNLGNVFASVFGGLWDLIEPIISGIGSVLPSFGGLQMAGQGAGGGGLMDTISNLPSVNNFVKQVVDGQVAVQQGSNQKTMDNLSAAGGGSVVVQNILDGRVISESVIDTLNGQKAVKNY